MMILVSVLVQCKENVFAGFTAAKKTIIQNWITPHMCGKTYWIRSLLQIVTCNVQRRESVGPGLQPLMLGSVFCWIYVIVWRSDFCVFVVLPSLPPFWLDFEMLSMCLLFCFVIFWMLCCVMCEKNKYSEPNISAPASVSPLAFAVLLLAVIKQHCIAAGAPFWIGSELPVFVVRPHAPNWDNWTVTVRYEYIYRATPHYNILISKQI